MKLKEHLRRLRQSRRLEQDKRLGVPLGILWGLAISVVLWALIRWLLGAAITALAGL
jgi:tetrahydromethanopterin S-methyltransferase subunit G